MNWLIFPPFQTVPEFCPRISAHAVRTSRGVLPAIFVRAQHSALISRDFFACALKSGAFQTVAALATLPVGLIAASSRALIWSPLGLGGIQNALLPGGQAATETASGRAVRLGAATARPPAQTPALPHPANCRKLNNSAPANFCLPGRRRPVRRRPQTSMADSKKVSRGNQENAKILSCPKGRCGRRLRRPVRVPVAHICRALPDMVTQSRIDPKFGQIARLAQGMASSSRCAGARHGRKISSKGLDVIVRTLRRRRQHCPDGDLIRNENRGL